MHAQDNAASGQAQTGAKALLISAIASGQSKTTVTAALARKLARAGKRVRVFSSRRGPTSSIR